MNMPVNAKIIRHRIKSIGNTKKITKAMEMIAAVKMRKAVRAALSTRAYAVLAREMLGQLAKMRHLAALPLMQARPVKNILLILIGSNRGLCGGFNSNIYKKTLEQIKNVEQIAVQRSFGKRVLPPVGTKINLFAITIGKKSERIMRKLNIPITAAFCNMSDTPSLAEATPVAQIIQEEFIAKKCDKAAVIYTDYISAVSQKPTIRQILPISPLDLEKMIKMLGDHSFEREETKETSVEFLFEPNPETVLAKMLPRLTKIQIYQAILESVASEHSSRMLAMRNASDAAEEMIDDLVFTLNQARQANITREIAEISGGAAALE